MDPMTNPQPTEQEWAQADVKVIKFENSPIIGLQKEVLKNGDPYVQTVWMTLPQLRAVAIEETF